MFRCSRVCLRLMQCITIPYIPKVLVGASSVGNCNDWMPLPTRRQSAAVIKDLPEIMSAYTVKLKGRKYIQICSLFLRQHNF